MTREPTNEEVSLLADLRQAGYMADSLNDLLTNKYIPTAAVLVLLNHLTVVQDSGLKKCIVRGLATKETMQVAAAGPTLINEFHRAKDNFLLKWVIGNTLEVIADGRILTQLIEIVQDKSHGRAREMVAMALGKIKDPSVLPILIAGLSDPDIAGHCTNALGKVKSKEAIPHLESMLSHPKSWIRTEAKRALAKIESSSKRKNKHSRSK